MRKVIAGVFIRDGKLLVVRKRETYILPGGKLENGEGHYDCLSREFGEELSGTKIKKNINYYGSFTGVTPHSKTKLEAIIYFVRVDGKLKKPSKEINNSEFIMSKDLSREKFSEITENIIKNLKSEGYIE